jgi:hypothetical protein
LVLRVGFIPWYESVAEPQRQKLISALEFTGAKQGEDMERWLWNSKFSAVAADSIGFECKSKTRLPRPPCSFDALPDTSFGLQAIPL